MVILNRFACKEQSLLFDLFKAIDQIESSHKSEVFSLKRLIFLHACATCSELPSNISTMPSIDYINFSFSSSFSFVNIQFLLQFLVIDRILFIKTSKKSKVRFLTETSALKRFQAGSLNTFLSRNITSTFVFMC